MPPPENRNVTYFQYFEPFRYLVNFENDKSGIPVYSNDLPTEARARRRIKSQSLLNITREIDNSSRVKPDDPSYANALQALANNYIELGFWEKAADSLSNFIEISPNTAEAYRSLGHIYMALNRNQDAIVAYDRAISINRLDGESFLARGEGYAAISEYELALADFNEGIRLDPNSSDGFK